MVKRQNSQPDNGLFWFSTSLTHDPRSHLCSHKNTLQEILSQFSYWKFVLYFFFGTLRPTPDIGSTGDLWLKQSGGDHVAIFWERLRVNGVTPVWREVGGNGLEIPHPPYPDLILRGGTCHTYLHWCQRPAGYFEELEDDFYQAALQFLSVYSKLIL